MHNLIIQGRWKKIIILVIILLFAIFRVRSYQDSLSIGTSDSLSYITSSRLPLMSWDIFTANRPFSMNLFYKLLEPESEYQLDFIAYAWLGTTADRQYQPGLDRVVLAQSLVSIVGWSMLAWVVSKNIRVFTIQLLSVLFILAFSYSPQLAEWDGVLMSESLSISIFAILLSATIMMAFTIIKTEKY